MQTFISPTESYKSYIILEKYSNGENVSEKGAFPLSLFPEFTLKISRRLGICSCSMTVKNMLDNTQSTFDFSYKSTAGSYDCYELNVNFPLLCNNRDSCLFYYNISMFSDEDNIFYLTSINNVDFDVVREKENVRDFRLVLYADGFETPLWAKNAVMYHIFVDRFAKSSLHTLPVRDDCIINPDWENGIPEYAPYNGAPLANNTFFGGSICGIIEKLPYLKNLGVNVLYLSPVFKAYSNHKYDTGDYETVDEMFGGTEALDELCAQCQKLNMRVILDGVFNHTGDDSKYFNRLGKYDSLGAYQSEKSKYFSWYDFTEFPDEYSSWWGIKILPKLMNHNEELQEFFLGDKGIVRKWISHGTSGWRLDVADELPSAFLDKLRTAAKAEKNDALIIGEVWENAADKVAYSEMRRYFLGHELDSVMNYPIKNAVISLCTTGNAEQFYNTVTDTYSSYPDCCSEVVMNILSTHDTERILTVLSGVSGEGKTNAELSTMRLDEQQKLYAKKLLKVASVLQFTLPGMPSIFYGDEAGLEGYHDPFCRLPFPWGREDTELTEHYKKLCYIKRKYKALSGAKITFLDHSDGFVAYERTNGASKIIVLANLSGNRKCFKFSGKMRDILSDKEYEQSITLSSKDAVILKKA